MRIATEYKVNSKSTSRLPKSKAAFFNAQGNTFSYLIQDDVKN